MQTATYIAGISGVPISSGAPVVVNSSGRLGVATGGAVLKFFTPELASESAFLW